MAVDPERRSSVASWPGPLGLSAVVLFAFTPACPDCRPESNSIGSDGGIANDASTSPGPDGSVNPCTDGTPVFGPETFVRLCGPPSTEVRQFSVPDEGEICVWVQAGGVASATIWIDGAVVVGPDQFNPDVTGLTATATVTAGPHELRVRVASAPGSSLTLEIKSGSGQPQGPYCSEVAAGWCHDNGWTVVDSPDPSEGNLVCTIDGRSAQENCDSCAEYNILVWKNGSAEQYCQGTYSTRAGNVYGGHVPCQCGDNLAVCGTWDMQGCIPDP